MTSIILAALVYGTALSLLLIANILVSLRVNPRMWMQDLPERLKKRIPEKTPAEKKQTLVWMMPFMVLILLGPVYLVTDPAALVPFKLAFWQALVLSYGVFFVFNLLDLLLMDWFILCFLTPKFIVIEGLKKEDFRDYGHHFRAFLRGTGVIAIPAILTGSAGYFLQAAIGR